MTMRCFLDFKRICNDSCKAFLDYNSDPYDCSLIKGLDTHEEQMEDIVSNIRNLTRIVDKLSAKIR